jgi:alkyl hydroperoxide reductase subunit AhpC
MDITGHWVYGASETEVDNERGTRKWTNEAQAEKKLKALKLPMPDDVVAVVSSGSTMAHESDPRPTVLLIGQQLTNALNKL